MNDDKYRFTAEWFDPTVKVKREFLISYFPSDRSIEMYDMQSKRIFLRRMPYENVDVSDLFVGSMVNILSRQIYITGFGDKKTAEKFSRDLEATLAIINLSGFKHMGKIISVLERNDLIISRGKMINHEKHNFNGSSFINKLERKFVVLELRGEDSYNVYKKLLGEDATTAKMIKAELGELKDYCLGPTDLNNVKQEIMIFFPEYREVHCNSMAYENSTCCIIKPHAVREQLTGKIIQDILDAGFEVTAFEVITLNLATASEFLEVYKSVVAEYKEMVAQLMSGPCVALEVVGQNGLSTVQDFRNLVGPADPEIASTLRPRTLRASYGQSKVKNAVHCTDLPEDAELEIDYMFRVLFA